ncbi:MAG: hypothetical protein NC200_00220 [Candidatus Gastranaerophilales bacterium]|nr:hypothetical protein [Candidatus Gastranaerophilales bacterium]
MQINSSLQPIQPLYFTGKKSSNPIDSKDKENDSQKHSSRLLPKLCLATAGFFIGTGAAVQTVYDAFNFSPIVESEQTSFDNRTDAMEYAKEKIINELNKPYPREYMVYIGKNNDILGEYRGDSESVYGDLLFFDMLKTKIPGYNYTSIHGHPDHDGLTTPLSFSDFKVLNNNDKLHEEIALNKDGEYSSLKKTDKFEPLDYDTLYELGTEIWNRLTEESKEKMPEKWEQIGEITEENKNNPFNYNYIDNDSIYVGPKYTEEDVIIEYQTSIDGIKCIHNFWKETAPKINLIYETNYSYLN